jgi:lipopolysaccharide transport system permease protein
MAFFLTPVLYPLSSAPEKLKLLLSINPMAGMIEGTRYAILGGAVSWPLVYASFASSVLLFLIGLYFFRRMERMFADVI